MMLIGHSIAQSVHLMQRSSSRRNIPRNRSEGIFFCSGYWIVSFFFQKWRPVTASPSKRSSSVSLSSHFFRAIRSTFQRGARLRGQPVTASQRLAEPREQEHRDEENSEDPGERHEAVRASRSQEDRHRHDHDVDEGG